eukprot:TRINITY_DN5303_c0_g2_i1.p1 TRINITY_DN5303_c0_g2~~TRINITY_DN5303_c0_g2_i1.p1  ORF type:complete len:379 (-),score=189.75 TRINITY_DN5303_c0_g2_i1:721-1857(-)
MVNSQIKDGKHVDLKNKRKQHSADTLKTYNEQDLGYMTMKNTVEQKKITKLQDQLHFIEAAAMKRKELLEEELARESQSAGEKVQYRDLRYENRNKNVLASKRPKFQKGKQVKSSRGKHVIFLDDEKEAHSFDAADYFDTLPEFVDRTFNRPKKSQLKDTSILNSGLSDLKYAGADERDDALHKYFNAKNSDDLFEAKQLLLAQREQARRGKRTRGELDSDEESDLDSDSDSSDSEDSSDDEAAAEQEEERIRKSVMRKLALARGESVEDEEEEEEQEEGSDDDSGIDDDDDEMDAILEALSQSERNKAATALKGRLQGKKRRKKEEKAYRELEARMKRQQILEDEAVKLQLQKHLMGKGKRRKTKDGKMRWKKQRSK